MTQLCYGFLVAELDYIQNCGVQVQRVTTSSVDLTEMHYGFGEDSSWMSCAVISTPR